MAGFVGTSNLLKRDGTRLTVRPEKVRLLDGDSPNGLHTERGRVAHVAYAGMITRYLVELEAGGTLQVVRQNLESSSQEELERQGTNVVVGWLPEHTVAIAEQEWGDEGA